MQTRVSVIHSIRVFNHRGSVYVIFSFKQIRISFIPVGVLLVLFKGNLLVGDGVVSIFSLKAEKSVIVLADKVN